MKGLKPFLSLVLGFLAFVIMTGCSGSTPTNGPGALNVAQFTLADGVVGVPYKQLLIASGGLTPYTWTISTGSLPPGLSLTTDGIISGTPTTVGAFNFTAKVTDSQTPVAAFNTYTSTVTINPPLSLTSATLANGTAGLNYNQNVTATGGLMPYTYAVAFGSLPDGLTLDPTSGSITGVPTAAGTFDFTIQASDAVSEVATGAFVITIVGRLQGPYAFTFNGFDNGQPIYMAGSIVTDGNGAITSGVLDETGADGVFTNVPVTGTYTIPSGSNLGQLVMATYLNTYVYNIVISTTSDSKIILADVNHPQTWGSGLVKKQQLTTLTGGSSYSFGFFGNDSGGSRYAGAGMFSLDSSLNVTAGAQDTNDNGTVSGEVAISGGSFVAPATGTGRGTMSLTTASGTTNYVYYVVSIGEMVAIQIDTVSGSSQTLYSILQQPSAGTTGGFTSGSLKGQSVLELNAVTNSAPDISTGVATFDGAGNITRTDGLPAYYTDENNGGTVTQNSDSGTYSVDATCGTIASPCGRVTVSLQGATAQPVWYLVSTGQAFVVGTDTSVTQGTLVQQTGFPYTIGSIIGSYSGGSFTPVLSSVNNEIDVAVTPPNGTLSINYLISGPGGISVLGQPGSFTGPYDCNVPGQTPCSAMGAAFGRFEVINTTTGTPVKILYIAGSGATGATGTKAGLVALDVANYAGGTEPNPKLTQFGR